MQRRRAAPALAEHADGVGIVDHHQRAIRVSEATDCRQVGDNAVHRKHAVGGDQDGARTLGTFERCRERIQVAIGVGKALRLAQANAVDDAGMVQRVADDRVFFVQQHLEQAGIGVEARREQDGVVGAEVARKPLLQRAVDHVRTADEAHGSHAEAVLRETLVRRLHDFRIIGEAEIVVGAKIEHAPLVDDAHPRVLGRIQRALRLQKSLGGKLGARGGETSEGRV